MPYVARNKNGQITALLRWGVEKFSDELLPADNPEVLAFRASRDPDYLDHRAAAYPPIGDQLDAILKWVNMRRLAGEDMPADLDQVIGQWLAVKAKFPKPEI